QFLPAMPAEMPERIHTRTGYVRIVREVVAGIEDPAGFDRRDIQSNGWPCTTTVGRMPLRNSPLEIMHERSGGGASPGHLAEVPRVIEEIALARVRSGVLPEIPGSWWRGSV